MSKTCPSHETNKTWSMVRLGDVCEVQRGGSPRPIKEYVTDSPDGLNWIKIGDVDPAGKYITQTAEKIKASGLCKTRKVAAGDFLLSNSMSFGRPYILKIDGCIHDGWLVLKGFSKAYSEDFFYYLLRSPIVQEQFDKLAHGSTVRNLNTDVVSMVSLPLPPLSVQREIVARLERELAAVEKMKKGFEELAETAKAEFKAELKEVFEEISRGGAETRRLGEVCEFMTSGSRGWAKYYSDSGELFITIKNVKDCAIDVRNVQHVKPPKGAEAERTRVKEGDLLISITADLGRTGIVTKAIEATGAYINQHLICIRLKKEILLPIFAAYYIESEGGKKQILHRNKEAVKAGLNFASVSSILLPFPSVPVQREVVSRLDSAKARAEKLEAKAQEGVAVCETMRKAILKEAFE